MVSFPKTPPDDEVQSVVSEHIPANVAVAKLNTINPNNEIRGATPL